MKFKRNQLLKVFGTTGILGAIAVAPIIVTSCSTSNQSKINLELNDSINLIGGLSGIYDGTTSTNQLIAKLIENNPSSAFKNGNTLKDQKLNVTVDGDFPSSKWTGKSYDGTDGWSENTEAVFYDSSLSKLSFSSLDDLKDQLTNDKIREILEGSGIEVHNSEYETTNQIGVTNGDLLHINIVNKSSTDSIEQDNSEDSNSNESESGENIDLQIPASSIIFSNLNCKISVEGNDSVNELKEATTNFNYQIGIDSTTHYNDPDTLPTIDSSKTSNVSELLKSLKFADNNDPSKLISHQIASSLGVYNCTFSNPALVTQTQKSQDTSASTNETKVFSFTLEATPDSNCFWIDGTNTPKQISFNASFQVQQNTSS